MFKNKVWLLEPSEATSFVERDGDLTIVANSFIDNLLLVDSSLPAILSQLAQQVCGHVEMSINELGLENFYLQCALKRLLWSCLGGMSADKVWSGSNVLEHGYSEQLVEDRKSLKHLLWQASRFVFYSDNKEVRFGIYVCDDFAGRLYQGRELLRSHQKHLKHFLIKSGCLV